MNILWRSFWNTIRFAFVCAALLIAATLGGTGFFVGMVAVLALLFVLR